VSAINGTGLAEFPFMIKTEKHHRINHYAVEAGTTEDENEAIAM